MIPGRADRIGLFFILRGDPTERGEDRKEARDEPGQPLHITQRRQLADLRSIRQTYPVEGASYVRRIRTPRLVEGLALARLPLLPDRLGSSPIRGFLERGRDSWCGDNAAGLRFGPSADFADFLGARGISDSSTLNLPQAAVYSNGVQSLSPGLSRRAGTLGPEPTSAATLKAVESTG